MTDAVGTITESLPIPDEQKQQIQQKAGQVSDQVSGQITSQVGARANQVGGQASSIADALRSSGRQLEEQGQTAPANVINMAADRADQLGTYLSSSDPNQILADVEDFCRQQPWVVIAGGIALGFLGARFLKASGSRRYRQYSGSPARSQAGYPTNGYQREVFYEPDGEIDVEVYREGGI
ncbi:MAG TPA: hypothetical protein VFB34_02825 [Chloroflexota bacterium]|nr:hypothetical protein [Chloroflexota bacterium]